MQPTELLNSLGLGEYIQAFEENAIDAESLQSLTDADLKELGVAKLGHRKKILEAIASISSEPEANHSDTHRETLSRLPNIVALPLREYASEEHPVAKLWSMCDTIELLLRLLVVVLVSRQRERGGLSEKTAESLSSLVESPTLGAWFVMAQTLSKDADGLLREAANFVDGALRDLLYGPDKPGTAETSLLRLRNRLAHGGGLTRREAGRLLQLWQSKFDQTVSAMQWLSGWELVGRDKEGRWLSLAGFEPANASFTPEESAHEADAVWIKIAHDVFPLWPLAVFGAAKAPGASKAGAEDLTQIYTRRDSIRLAYTPIGAEGLAQSESGASGFEAFKALFRLDRPRKADFSVPDFAAEIRKDASQTVGREQEVEAIAEAVHRTEQGVLWISGVAGMGKSFLMAKAFAELSDGGRAENTTLLFYRFRSSDQNRCSRESLADFLEERLLPSSDHKKATGKADAALRLRNCFDQLKGAQRVVVFLDGLDEVGQRDSQFAEEIPLALRYPNLLWVCSGRPEAGLQTTMASHGAFSLFARGLPPMQSDSIRGMIMEKIGPIRKKLLAGDKEKGEDVVNPFVDLITARAEGLPLYVKYVVGDILSGKYRVLDGQEALPESLHAYHEELLRRLAVGDLQAVVTPLVATLACAHEPLSAAEIQTVLLHRKLVTAEGVNDLFDRALAATSSMLATSADPEGESGYTIFHQSLRDHMHSSNEVRQSIAMAGEAFADLAVLEQPPAALSNYLLRCGPRHLIESNRTEEAKKLLLDLYHVERMESAGLGWPELYRLWSELGGENQTSAYADSFAVAFSSSEGPARATVLAQGRRLLVLHYEAMWFSSGERIGRIVVDAHAKELGASSPETIEAATLLASILALKADHSNAETIFRQTLATVESAMGRDHALFGRTASELGQLLLKTGKIAEAEDLLRQALLNRESTLGAEHPDTLESANHLATLLMTAKDDALGARLLYERALDGRTKVLGPRHLYTLESVNNLANIHLRSGELDRAEELYRRSFAGNMAILGPLHPATLIVNANVATVLRARGDIETAEKLLTQSLRGAEMVLGKENPQTLLFADGLARNKMAKGDFHSAWKLFQRAFAENEKHYGFNHPQTLKSAAGLADAFYHLENFDEAEHLLRRCRTTSAELLGENHRATLGVAHSLACVLHSKWELEEAKEILQTVIESPSLKSDPVGRFTVMADLARILEDSFDFEGAEKTLWQVYEGRRQVLGPKHALTGQSMQVLADRLRSKGDSDAAEALLKSTPQGE